ncbi:YfjI family protein [Gemmata massiliana]|uniref:YfjI family protein n=1 Tax=Gemmata massiliana TaxID=1210884 RepID=UPI0013A6C189|nr:YfjI family protein [Gemmata massiliana]
MCAAARDEEVEHRGRDVHDTNEKLQCGEAVTGLPALLKELGENGRAILSAVTAWLELPQKEPDGPKVAFGRPAPKVPPAPPFTPLPEWRPFPVDLLPGAVREFVTTVSTAMRCDLTYVALPALAVCSGMIGATRTIRLKKSWSEPAMLWTAVVGESGTLKTPPYKRAIAPVVAMQTEQLRGYKVVHEQYRADLREYERAKRRAKDDDPGDPPAEPVCPRIYSRDVTVEALAGILTHNRTRFLIGRDELSGWLASFNQYKSKGGSDLANWLELHGLGTLSVDRKTGEQKTILVSGVGVSLCGGIQPGVLRGALSAQHFSAGIPARLLFAYPPRHPKQWTEDDLDEHVEERYTRLVRALAELQPNTDESGEPYPVPLGLAPDAKAEWVRFYTRFALKQSETEGELAAAFSKLEGYAARLALVHHVCLSVDAGLEARDPIPLASVRAGIALAEWFAHEAQRVYQMLREDRGSTEARDLFERACQLAARHGGRVTARELAKSNKIKYPQAAAAEAALEGLVAQGLGDWIDLDTGPKGGRPTHGFVPRLLSGETGETPETPDAPDDDPPPPPGPSAPRSGETRPHRPALMPAETTQVTANTTHPPLATSHQPGFRGFRRFRRRRKKPHRRVNSKVLLRTAGGTTR